MRKYRQRSAQSSKSVIDSAMKPSTPAHCGDQSSLRRRTYFFRRPSLSRQSSRFECSHCRVRIRPTPMLVFSNVTGSETRCC
jgi:hypothetical protein